MGKEFKRLLYATFITILIANGCRKQDITLNKQPEKLNQNNLFNSEKREDKVDTRVIQLWYNLMLKLIIGTPGNTPPIAARSFGYTGIALYESLLPGNRSHHSLAGQLNGLTAMPELNDGNNGAKSFIGPISANAALAGIIKDLFKNTSAANLNTIDSLELANEKYYSEDGEQQKKDDNAIMLSKNFGHSIANAIYMWSLTDGGDAAYLNNFPPGYIPPTGIDKWVPTLPAFQIAMLPYWGNNRPMVINDNPGPVDPPAPPAFSTTQSSIFYNEALKVYNTKNNLTSEQINIALYWADGGGSFTPPGHNVAIALQMIRNSQLDLFTSAMLLAKLGIAENDASIVCWRAKYNTNLLRPVTYIRSYIDPSWTPLIVTPPFPTYTSGHSTFSSASATILTSMLGTISFTDSSKIPYGFSTRSFNSFNEAASEAALSRLYGGIHYEFDNNNGFNCGKLIGNNVILLKW